jgi:hypothetical protein
MKEWANFVKSNSRWKAVSNKPTLNLQQGTTTGQITLDPNSQRITKFSNKVGSTTTTWTIQYGSVTVKEPFKLPSNAYQVAAFSDQSKLPKMDKATASFASKMLRNYEPPVTQFYRIKDDNGVTTVYYDRKGIYQRDSNIEFSYDGIVVTLKSKAGKTYSGQTKIDGLLSAASSQGSRVDPFLRDLVLGINPIQRILESATSAKLAGSTKVNGSSTKILQAKNAEINLTLFVRESDFRIVRITTSLPGDFNYKASRDFEQIKEAPTRPRVEASGSLIPLTQLTR